MQETSKKLFWSPGGPGRRVNGWAAGGPVLLKFAFLVFLVIFLQTLAEIDARSLPKKFLTPRALCVQMDFTRTFEANTKCKSIKYVWSHFYQLLVVLKYHRCLWNNIFDTDIFRCINTNIKGVYLAIFGIFMLLEMSVSKILFHRRLWYIRTTKIW